MWRITSSRWWALPPRSASSARARFPARKARRFACGTCDPKESETMSKQVLTMTVNGRVREDAVTDNLLLLDYLRDELGLTGTKQGCDLSLIHISEPTRRT